MRGLLSVLLTLAVSAAPASERTWQSGTWRDSGEARTYVILTATFRYHLEDIPPVDTRALTIAADTPVRFAVDESRFFVLDRDGKEHELRLVRRVDLTYSAIGGGHYVKTVGADGQSVTLEDGSIWEIDPRAQFFTVDWQPFDNIAIRRTAPDRGFNYEIDNTDQDNGALARYSPP
jgi:hypothetical protein